jgi:cytosine/adenosine deaminase-related metal-dependent hydrolase
VTAVGDITYGPEAPSAALTAGLGGTFFWEVLGVPAPALYAELEKMEFPTEPEGSCGPRMRCGLSPHSPYTSGPRLLAAMHEAAGELRCPFALHAAESGAEVALLQSGTGPLAPVAERNADGFAAPGCGPLAYLDQLGVLVGATVVHAGHAGPSDVARLTATARGVVACPRSNAFLSNPVAPVARMIRAGIPVGLGTDSAASNHDLDLMAEVRALRETDSSIPATRLLEMVTTMGAIALGLEDRFVMLERGMRADLAVFRLGETNDPIGAVVDRGGASTIEAVLSEGVWRILAGEPTEDLRQVELGASAARVKAEHALQRA